MLDTLREQLQLVIGDRLGNSLPRMILDQLPVGVVIARAPGGALLFQNRRADAILGHTMLRAEEVADYAAFGAFHLDGRPFAPHDHALPRVLADGVRIEGERCLYRRADGAMVSLSVDADLIRDARGAPVAAIAVFQDISAQAVAEEARATLERQLARAMEATSDSVFVVDRNWRLTYLNAKAAAQVALGRDLVGVSLWEAFPEAVGGACWRAYHEAMETGRPTQAQEHFPPLGVTFEARANPFEGGLAVFFRDVTAEHAAQQAQRQLTRELAHRVGNLFTLVAGMVKMTARRASDVQEMADKLTGRVMALSRAHNLVRPDEGAGAAPPATLAALVASILEPHRDLGGAVRLECGEIAIGPDAATALALVLHELATNAAKYGALAGGGRLTVTVEPLDEAVTLIWREQCAHPVTPPDGASGFGASLVRLTAQGRLGGGVAYDWRADGVEIRLTCAAERLKG